MTQCPFPPAPVETPSRGVDFRALSEMTECPNQFICLQSFPWDPNMRREQRVKIDVERRGIIRPSTGACRGIFYDPRQHRAVFYSEPPIPQSGTTFSERGIDSESQNTGTQRKEKAKMRPIIRYHPYPKMSSSASYYGSALVPPSLPPIGIARAGALVETHTKSDIDDDLVKLGKRFDDAQGLHYILVDLPDESSNLALTPIIEEGCFMLLFDTGCPLTWVYGKPTEILKNETVQGNRGKVWPVATGKYLERVAAAQSYDWKTRTDLAAGSTETVKFADGLVTWLKLHKGRARVVRTGITDSFTLQELKFAVCIAATPEKVCMQMDGILGMAHKTMDFGTSNNSDLVPYKLAQERRSKHGARFIVALDEDASYVDLYLNMLESLLTWANTRHINRKSWLVLSTRKSRPDVPDLVDQRIPHENWDNNWVPTITSTLFHWVFNVVCFSTPTVTHQLVSEARVPLLMPFILDTGTLYSYFPTEIFESLRAQMNALRSPTGQPYVLKSSLERLKNTPIAIQFHHSNSTKPVEIHLGSLDITVKLFGARVPMFTDDLRRDLAAQLRAALPSMQRFEGFTVARDVAGGIWSELLDALCAAPAPFKLQIDALWFLEAPPLAQRANPLPLKGLVFPFAILTDEADESIRRNRYMFEFEVPNLQPIIIASAGTMESLALPGEHLRLLEGIAWNALTELLLVGFWPLFHESDASESEESSGEEGYFTDDFASPERAAVPAPPSLPRAPPSTGHVAADPEAAADSRLKSSVLELEPTASSTADLAPEMPERVAERHLPESTVLPLPSPTVLPDTTSIDPPSVDLGPRPLESPKPSVESRGPLSDVERPIEPLIDGASALGSPTPAAVPHASVAAHPETPTRIGSAAKPPAVADTGRSSPAPNRSRMLSVLEAMPNLRKLRLQLRHHIDDETPIGDFICASDGSSVPRSPETFLQRLLEFQVTSLSPEDRTVDFLPANLEVLCLDRYPRIEEINAVLVEPRVAAVLGMLEHSWFPRLKTLKLWYVIKEREDLVLEEKLLDLLPKLFPLVETFELFRGWDHAADSLAGLWDPVPLMKNLVSQFKQLQTVAIDLDLPERFRAAPFVIVNREFREMMVRVHGMATEIVGEAPRLQRIQVYRELGRDQDYYWETWGVVVGADGEVKLDRPPPLISDNPFYPDPWFHPNDLVDSDSDDSSSNEADAS
ncbi:F-box domain-containing protein [Mycena chlorophos]|uniref:F-box domain-containing protein n=1 Tax=Mycena chlorophos TaxID=658473 RepID=A0A8H6S8U6_MYCCL|nr:F-box domain-containing protein [Mycena chlorophos]